MARPAAFGALKNVEKAAPACGPPPKLRLCYSHLHRLPLQGDYTTPMILTSLLLAAVTFNPAMAPRVTTAPAEGIVQASVISPDKTCAPGAICASNRLPINRNGCFVNNFWNGSVGGTPLTIDVTQTGGNGSKVYIYWINATNKNIVITGNAMAKYYCP
jgi:hypothetical protein